MTLLTRAEKSGFTETSRHADVLAFVEALAADARVSRMSLGVTPEGRELPLLGIRAAPRGAKIDEPWRPRPLVLVMCGIHAGEVEGKEAALMLVRDLLAGAHPGILERISLLLVPLFNADGNDRIDPKNRVLDLEKHEGQIGPASGVGTRVNAAGINLNRDYMRKEALESRLLHAAWTRLRPHLTIDCHSTDGSVHRFALTYDTAHAVDSGRAEPIGFVREELLPEVSRRVRAASGRETFFYGNFVDDEGGAPGEQGWATYTHHPRFGSNYRGLTGRMDVLFECYSYMSFEERVATSYELLLHALAVAGGRGDEIRRIVDAAALPPERIGIRYRLEADREPARILTRTPRTLEGEPAEVTLPHLCRFVATRSVDRPWAYLVPEAIARRLATHGLEIDRLSSSPYATVEVARVAGAEAAAQRAIVESPLERLIEVDLVRETRRLPAGASIVRTDQPFGAVATYLLEPESDDGLIACGMVGEPVAGDEWPALRVLDPVL